MARILLIDDENNIRMLMRLALEQKKWSVETAGDGTEGLAKFGDGLAWDLIILDERMPGKQGLEVLREMRRRDPNARIILISAFGSVSLVVEALAAGATHFLRKPFTLETLRAAVRVVLDTPSAPPQRMEERIEQPSSLTYSMTTLNGYRIEYQPGSCLKTEEDTIYTFTVHSKDREIEPCTILLPNYLKELVKSYANTEFFPGSERFWESICEDVLANYIWKHGTLPVEGVLRLDEMTGDIKHWVDTVLRAS